MAKKVENPYASKAMLVSVAFSKWEPRKYDKTVSQEVADKHQTTIDAGRYNKRLFVKTPASLKAVNSALSAASETYYNETLPWSDAGCRLLPCSNYLRFCEAMRRHQAEIEDAARRFAIDYPALIDEAKKELNGLFNRADYPAVSEIEGRFGMASKFYPVPTGADFRVSLSADHLADLQAAIDSDTQKAIEDAMLEAFGQLFDAAQHMAEMLCQPDPKRSIKDVLVENTREAVARVKRLNLTKDAKLEQIGERILADLCTWDGGTLRSVDSARETVAKAAINLKEELADILDLPTSEPLPAPEPEKPKGKGKTPKAKKTEKPVKTASAPKKAPKAETKPAVTMAAVEMITNDLAAMMGMV